MKTKGLFDSLFIVTMILFLIPAVIIPNPAHNIIETKNYVNLVSLNIDEIVNSTIYEITNGVPHSLDHPAGHPDQGNFCRIKYEGNFHKYTNKLEENLDDFFEETEKIYNVSCDYKLSNIDFIYNGGYLNAVYKGKIDLTCSSKNNFSEVFIEKTFDFDKNITALFPKADDFNFIFSPIPKENYDENELPITNNLLIEFPFRNSKITYTLDNSTPTSGSSQYLSKDTIEITGDVNITVKAFNPGPGNFPYNLYRYPSDEAVGVYEFVAGGDPLNYHAYHDVIPDSFYHDGTCQEIIIVNN